MLFARFSVQCHPEHTEEMARRIAAVEAPSRALPGVLHFDTTRSLTDPDTFVVLEVFTDEDAFHRQNNQSEVAAVLALANAGALTRDLEWAIWEAGS
ncbi:putative quinol monooxygenase [Nocardioides marmorisolisilvae]|uniref:ABM domain-containing protein n=1 Tax=Nocardioides marmorisolisilvae TaxID=1542737 RepID=A0A3N0DTN6_9ACTN|nr:antibiotic biosynthesis monooxygenase [Nocardioides marmorisolisilvae]RNL78987.1 hypothetical protein EFL95_08030 [Nocardioides marmorisolisilvae]